MTEEVLQEVKRISDNKKVKNTLTILYVYLVRVLVAFIPVVLLAIINFIIVTFLNLFGSNAISATYNFIYHLIVTIVSFFTFIITSPFLFGCLNNFLNEAKEENKTEKLTKYLTNKNLCKKQMLMTLELLVGTIIGLICFLIPGIIYFSKRIMAPFILIDNEEITIKGAFEKSKEIMTYRYKELIVVCLKLVLPAIIIYVITQYLTHFTPYLIILGNLFAILSGIILMVALSDALLAAAVMYTKINGKKMGAIDVEYREIK